MSSYVIYIYVLCMEMVWEVKEIFTMGRTKQLCVQTCTKGSKNGRLFGIYTSTSIAG